MKYFYFNPRPSQMDPELKTIIGLPNFPSYTSGHSTFSGAAAEVLSYLFPGGRADFEAQRDEASISRLYGGIHYRSDLEVGSARSAHRRLYGELRPHRRRGLRAPAGIRLPVWPPMHPAGLRCSSLTYARYARSSRLAGRAPRRPN